METEKDNISTLADRLRSGEAHPNTTPVIRTFEGDILNAVRDDNISKISTLSRQLDSVNDSAVYDAANSMDRKKKMITITLSTLFVLLILGAGASYYYFKVYKKPVPVVVAEVKKYYIKDMWTSAPFTFIQNTDTATSTDSSVLADVKDFDALYYYSLNDEEIFKSLAKEKFGYNSLEKSVDISVENQDLRIADGELGAFVYGFVGKKHFLATNNLAEWIKISKTLK